MTPPEALTLNTCVLSPSSSLLVELINDCCWRPVLCILRWKHYRLLKIFYDWMLKSASTFSLRSGLLHYTTDYRAHHVTNNQAWPMLISKRKNAKLHVDFGLREECQVQGNFSVLRHLTCQGKLCNHYRQVSLYVVSWSTYRLVSVKLNRIKM